MPGKKEFEVVVASAPREALKSFSTTRDTAIAAGLSEIVDLYSMAGTIGITQSAYFDAPIPAGATSGNHVYTMTTTAQSGAFVTGESTFASSISMNYRKFLNANFAQHPSTDVGQVEAIRGNYFDDVIGLRFVYTNTTNVSQANARSYKLVYIERTRG